MRIRVPKTFVPREARAIANDFRRNAAEVRRLASQLSQLGSSLNATWEGKSKNTFMGEFSPEPGRLHSYANYLDECARKIERMTVTVWEEKEVEDQPR